MRLSEIQKIIEENKDLLSISIDPIPRDSNLCMVKNVTNVLIALHKLERIPSLKEHINIITSIPEISTIHTSNQTVVANANCNKFNNELATLKIECNAILSLANNILPTMDKDMICIKLPEESDLKTLSDIADNFSKLFTAVLTVPEIEGNIKFVGVEAGCSWLYIKMTGKIIAIINIIINNIYNVFNKYITTKKANLDLQSLEKDIKIKTSANIDIEQVLHALCEKAIKEINNNELKKLDEGELGKFTRTMENLVKILEKGMEIHPSLMAPPEIQEEKNNQILLLQKQIKAIKLLEFTPKTSEEESSLEDNSDNSTDV
ncbi:hypothetical protein NXG27_01105 [Megasphaera paucivorans]|uniref:Uncharacterized protein n=1 Tax=Megasphaera paucivorans TaxID=349095 RepID=A0A1G9QHN0_9FIRM|nr:hypothetical protein [Megasphaera paucivorans]SDM09785.1 hypothetical protein SAMN05660299_00222 [Megasphaera paucivorans]